MTLLKVSTTAEVLSGSLIAIIIVFLVLVLLILAFTLVGRMSKHSSAKRLVKETGVTIKEAKKSAGDVSANDVAAISLALHMFLNEVHDNESNIITIKHVERRYSPWNSKIYGLTNLR